MLHAVFGFDLDMTLVDSGEAIVDALVHVADHYGAPSDPVALAATIGLPLQEVFPNLVPGVAYDEALALYRGRYLSHGVPMSRPLPGALESLQLLRDRGEQVIVISAKHADHIDAVLIAVGLRRFVDALEGERFAAAKGEVLQAYGAWAYAGDHPGDVVGALVAGARAIGVATGPTSAADLLAAGADPVLGALTELPAWLAGRRRPVGASETPHAG